MKELRKRLLALGMGAVMIFGVGAFAGCNGGNKEQTSQTPSTGTTTPDKDTDNDEPSQTPDDNQDENQDDPETPPQPPARTKAEAVADFNAAVQKINADKNFTYTEIGAEYIAEFEGAKLKVTENGTSVFYATEGDKHYSYTLRGEVWHKDFSETTAAGIFSSLTAVLGDVIWSDFEAEENLLTGTASGETVQATVTETALTVETAQKKFTLTKLGTTAVSLPADAVDDTDASNFIFTTDENGETVWNVKAIKEVLEPWLKNEGEGNQYGKDVFAAVRVNDKYKTREILYINPSKEEISFGMIYDVEGQLRFGASYFKDLSFYENLTNMKAMTKTEFHRYLKQLDKRRINTKIVDFDVEYTTHDEDYETAHKQEFETLTKNGFERLATVGYKDLTDNEGTKVDFSGAKVLFGFRTPVTTDIVLMPNSTYHRIWRNYYLLEKDGKMELINFIITGRTGGPGAPWSYTAIESVLQNITNAWNISSIERREISTENLVLFDAPIMTIGKIA